MKRLVNNEFEPCEASGIQKLLKSVLQEKNRLSTTSGVNFGPLIPRNHSRGSVRVNEAVKKAALRGHGAAVRLSFPHH